jgi:hypothetical protein
MFMYSYCYVCSVLCIPFHCVVLCIVCVQMCTVLLPQGVIPTAVNKIYIISYHNTWQGFLFMQFMYGGKYNRGQFMSDRTCTLRLLHVVSMERGRSFSSSHPHGTWLRSDLQTSEGYVRNLIRCCGNSHTASNGKTINEQWIAKDAEGGCHGVDLRYHPKIFLEVIKKT